MSKMNVTVNDIHDEHIRECMQKTIDYIVKLERENCGLKEYKKHQERANERRYRSGGRVLAQRVSCRKEEVGGQNEQIKSKSNVE